MSKIDVNFAMTEEFFEKFNKQSMKYLENVDKFFMSILSNDAWKGDSATRYKNIVTNEKNVYFNFSEALDKFIGNSKSSIDDLKSTISNNSME